MTTITVNGRSFEVDEGMTVAAALIARDVERFRRSVGGEARGPLCGMGACFECRVTIDGVRHQRSCTVIARDGMEVATDD